MDRKRGLGIALGMVAFALAMTRLGHTERGQIEFAFCLAISLGIALVVAVSSGRIGFGLLVAGAIAGIVWLANALKLAYLHEPLLAPDLRYFARTTTLDVAAHYPHLWHKILAVLVGGLVLCIVVWRLEAPGFWRKSAAQPYARPAASLLAAIPLLLMLWPRGPCHRVYDIQAWDFIAGGAQNPVTTFVRSFKHLRPTPPLYSADDATRFDWGAATADAGTSSRPDLVAVLEESTLDPRQWAACDVPRCAFPMFEPDARTRAHGLLEVHTYGGATWTSEFAFLTGMPHTVFGPAGIYAPFNLAPRMRQTLPRQLKALGYRTIAIYPMPRDFVRAGEAYAEYGFDEFHDANELGLRWESTDSELVQAFGAHYRRLRGEGEGPLFFMLLTMRQHGPHDHPLQELPPPWNAPPLPALDARTNRNLATYLYRMQQSSDALAELRRLLDDAARPFVLVHFGDHHPSFDGLEGTLASALAPPLRAVARELTYYRIDSNLDRALPEQPRVLDLAFLGGVLLDAAGLPKNAYFEANARLRERCQGRFLECGQAHAVDSYFAHTFGTLQAFEP